MAPWHKQYFWYSLTGLFAVVGAYSLWGQALGSFVKDTPAKLMIPDYVYRSRADLTDEMEQSVKLPPSPVRLTHRQPNQRKVENKERQPREVRKLSTPDGVQKIPPKHLTETEETAVAASRPSHLEIPALPQDSAIEQVDYTEEQPDQQRIHLLGIIEPIQEEATQTILIRPRRVSR